MIDIIDRDGYDLAACSDKIARQTVSVVISGQQGLSGISPRAIQLPRGNHGLVLGFSTKRTWSSAANSSATESQTEVGPMNGNKRER
jgi:hypothetical protein